MSRGSSTSATNGRPNSFLTSASISRPFSPRPWKEYGDVRGLKASPRKRAAPALRTASAAANICSLLSTAQGPAITVTRLPPKGTPPASTTVSSLRTSRLTDRNGPRIGTARSTPGNASQGCWRTSSPAPMAPMTVRT